MSDGRKGDEEVFNRKITKRLDRWFDYIDSRLAEMDKKISAIELKVKDKSFNENVVNADEKCD
jgi:hypothetical protein